MPFPETSPDAPARLLTRRETLLRLLAPAAVLCTAPALTAFTWKLIQHEGRDYISAADIQKFYGFPRLQREGRHLWFRSKELVMRWTTGTDDIYINNVKFCLSFAVLERDGKLFVSRMDLSKLIDPIIKPSHIQNAIIFDTVVIDPGHGGEDSGAVGVLGLEKTYALDTSFRLKRKLEALVFAKVYSKSLDPAIALLIQEMNASRV